MLIRFLFLYSITVVYFHAVFAGDEDTFTILECLRIPAVYDPYTIGEFKSKVCLFQLSFPSVLLSSVMSFCFSSFQIIVGSRLPKYMAILSLCVWCGWKRCTNACPSWKKKKKKNTTMSVTNYRLLPCQAAVWLMLDMGYGTDCNRIRYHWYMVWSWLPFLQFQCFFSGRRYSLVW